MPKNIITIYRNACSDLAEKNQNFYSKEILPITCQDCLEKWYFEHLRALSSGFFPSTISLLVLACTELAAKRAAGFQRHWNMIMRWRSQLETQPFKILTSLPIKLSCSPLNLRVTCCLTAPSDACNQHQFSSRTTEQIYLNIKKITARNQMYSTCSASRGRPASGTTSSIWVTSVDKISAGQNKIGTLSQHDV